MGVVGKPHTQLGAEAMLRLMHPMTCRLILNRLKSMMVRRETIQNKLMKEALFKIAIRRRVDLVRERHLPIKERSYLKLPSPFCTT